MASLNFKCFTVVNTIFLMVQLSNPLGRTKKSIKFLNDGKYEVKLRYYDPSVTVGCVGRKTNTDYEEILELFTEDNQGFRDAVSLDLSNPARLRSGLDSDAKLSLKWWPDECTTKLTSSPAISPDPESKFGDWDLQIPSWEEIGESMGLSTTCDCPPGLPGIQGPRGRRGPPGPEGKPGKKGKDGVKGEPGKPLRGLIGPDGVAGLKGMQGDPGDKGDSGESGQDGLPGSDGSPGSKGEKGEPSPDGKIGDKGLAGLRGKPGTPGHKGPPGLPGIPGITPPKASDGQPGVPGIPGSNSKCNGLGIIPMHEVPTVSKITTPMKLKNKLRYKVLMATSV